MTPEQLPADWRKILADEFTTPYFATLLAFVNEQRAAHVVFPPEEDVFSAFRATPFAKVKVLLLGEASPRNRERARFVGASDIVAGEDGLASLLTAGGEPRAA